MWQLLVSNGNREHGVTFDLSLVAGHGPLELHLVVGPGHVETHAQGPHEALLQVGQLRPDPRLTGAGREQGEGSESHPAGTQLPLMDHYFYQEITPNNEWDD